MGDKLPSEVECKRASAVLNDVVQPAFRYAERKRLVVRPFAQFHENQDWWEGFPEEWEESVLGMLAAAAVFTRPERVAAFLRSSKSNLHDDASALVRRWRARPWAWAFFRVVEELGDRRLVVAPVGDAPSTWSDPNEWDELLIYSRSVTENYRRGMELFFGLLVDAGPAFVTYGAVIPFQGLDEADALFMADVVSQASAAPGSVPLLGVAEPDAPVSDIAAENPLPFLAMLRVSETPPVRTPQGPPGRYASWLDLPENADAWSEEAWRTSAEAAGEVLAGAVFDEAGGGVAPSPGDLVAHPGEGEMSEAKAAFRERVRPKKEADWLGLLRVRRLAESAGLLRLSGKRFEPTDTALRLVDDPAALYHHLLTTAFRTFDWAEHRWFEAPPYLHRMAGFLFYAAGELCDARRNDAGWVSNRLLVQRFSSRRDPSHSPGGSAHSWTSSSRTIWEPSSV